MTTHDEIRSVLARFIRAADAQDVDTLVPLFAAEGRFVVGEQSHAGHEAIGTFLRTLFGSAPAGRRTKHLNTSPVITVDGDRADCLSDTVVYHCFPGMPWTVTQTNRHRDALVLEDGEWKLAEKRIEDAKVFALHHAEPPGPAGA